MFSKPTKKSLYKSTATRITSSKNDNAGRKSEARDDLKKAYLLPKKVSDRVLGLVASVYLNSNSAKSFHLICPTKQEFYTKCRMCGLSSMMVVASIQMATRKQLESARVLRKVMEMEALKVELDTEDEIPAAYKSLIKELGGEIEVKNPPAPANQQAPGGREPIQDELESFGDDDSRFNELDDEEYNEAQREQLRKALVKYESGCDVPLDEDGNFALIDIDDDDFLRDYDLLMKGDYARMIVPFAQNAHYVYESIFMHVQTLSGGKFLVTGDVVPDVEYLHFLAFMYDHEDHLALKERIMVTSLRMDGVYKATAAITCDDGLYRGSLTEKIKLLANSGLHQNSSKGFMDVGNFWITYLPRLLHLEQLVREKCGQDLTRERKLAHLKVAMDSAGAIARTEAYGMANKLEMTEMFEKGKYALNYMDLHTSQIAAMMCRIMEVDVDVVATPEYLAENPHMCHQIRRLANYINDYYRKNSDEDIETFLRIIFYKGIFNELGSVTLLKKIMKKGTLVKLFPKEILRQLESVIANFDRDILDEKVIEKMRKHLHGKQERVAGVTTGFQMPRGVDDVVKEFEEFIEHQGEPATSLNASISINSDMDDEVIAYYGSFLRQLSKIDPFSIPNDRIILQVPCIQFGASDEDLKTMQNIAHDDLAAEELCAGGVYCDTNRWEGSECNPCPGLSTLRMPANHAEIIKNYNNYNGSIEEPDYIDAWVQEYSKLDRNDLGSSKKATAKDDSRFQKAHKYASDKTGLFANLARPDPDNIIHEDRKLAYMTGPSGWGPTVTKEMLDRAKIKKSLANMPKNDIKKLAMDLLKEIPNDQLYINRKICEPDRPLITNPDTEALEVIELKKRINEKALLKTLTKGVIGQARKKEEARLDGLKGVVDTVFYAGCTDTVANFSRVVKTIDKDGKKVLTYPDTNQIDTAKRFIEMKDIIKKVL